MAISCNPKLARFLSAPMALALVLGASILLPTIAFASTAHAGAGPRPPPGPGVFPSEILRRPCLDSEAACEVLVAIIPFRRSRRHVLAHELRLGGRGNDFHALPGFVGLVGGVGVAAGGIVGCLAFPALSRLMPLRPFYLTVGIVGGFCTLALILLPRTPTSFAILLITENLFQSLAITTSTAVTFETIGRDNPLASTTFCFVTSAFSVPISYMLYVDAFGFAHGGITGSLAIDAIAGILASVLLGFMLLWLSRRPKALTV